MTAQSTIKSIPLADIEAGGAQMRVEISPTPRPSVSMASVRVWREPTTPRETAMMCLLFSEPLTNWETKFLKSVAGRKRFSMKQQAVLDRTLGKARDYAKMEMAA